MITLYGFGKVEKPAVGETRDLRVQWALEETGLPYRVHGLDHPAGDMDAPEFTRISCFHQLPVIDDDGFILSESGAILLYLAEKAGKLIPSDFQGRTRVVQWSLAALSTVERPLLAMALLGDADDDCANKQREDLTKEAGRWLDGLERRLDGREWIACADFTVADILMAAVLRERRKTRLYQPYPNVSAYLARAQDRPAWRKTLESYAERLGVALADVQ